MPLINVNLFAILNLLWLTDFNMKNLRQSALLYKIYYDMSTSLLNLYYIIICIIIKETTNIYKYKLVNYVHFHLPVSGLCKYILDVSIKFACDFFLDLSLEFLFLFCS